MPLIAVCGLWEIVTFPSRVQRVVCSLERRVLGKSDEVLCPMKRPAPGSLVLLSALRARSVQARGTGASVSETEPQNRSLTPRFVTSCEHFVWLAGGSLFLRVRSPAGGAVKPGCPRSSAEQAGQPAGLSAEPPCPQLSAAARWILTPVPRALGRRRGCRLAGRERGRRSPSPGVKARLSHF